MTGVLTGIATPKDRGEMGAVQKAAASLRGFDPCANAAPGHGSFKSSVAFNRIEGGDLWNRRLKSS
jgi:hypothetical protein